MTGDPIARLIAAHVRAALPELPFYAIHEYRVVRQLGERIEVQAADESAGAPDLGVIELGTGIPGCTSELEGGALVLVGFVNHSDRRPRVLSYAPPGEGYRPITLSIDAKSLIKLAETTGTVVRVGSPAAQFVALAPATSAALSLIGGLVGLLGAYATAQAAYSVTPSPANLATLGAALTAVETALLTFAADLATLTGSAPAGLTSTNLKAE